MTPPTGSTATLSSYTSDRPTITLDLAGTYVFGDYCDGRIRLAAIQPDGSVAVRLTELTVPLLA